MSGFRLHWQSFGENFLGRDFVVGDIHGHFDLLQSQLDEVGFDPKNDRLFSVGDNIDRGPQSHQVLEWFSKPWFFSIMGNHEVMAIENHKFADWKNYAIHGGQWFLDLPREEQEVYVKAFEKLPIVFEVDTPHGRIGIVHAECRPNDWLKFKYEFADYYNDALWGMNRFYAGSNNKHHDIEHVAYVINGHMNVDQISRSGNTIYIDTGKLRKRLTLLEINHPDDLKYHQ